MNDSDQQKSVSNGVVPSAMVRRAEEYVETFCSLTDNTCGEVSTRFHAAVLLSEVRLLRLVLEGIAECAKPTSNATVKRMARAARSALPNNSGQK